jgi:hypothetical protein
MVLSIPPEVHTMQPQKSPGDRSAEWLNKGNTMRQVGGWYQTRSRMEAVEWPEAVPHVMSNRYSE